jgi:hypothetical protein
MCLSVTPNLIDSLNNRMYIIREQLYDMMHLPEKMHF